MDEVRYILRSGLPFENRHAIFVALDQALRQRAVGSANAEALHKHMASGIAFSVRDTLELILRGARAELRERIPSPFPASLETSDSLTPLHMTATHRTQ